MCYVRGGQSFLPSITPTSLSSLPLTSSRQPTLSSPSITPDPTIHHLQPLPFSPRHNTTISHLPFFPITMLFPITPSFFHLSFANIYHPFFSFPSLISLLYLFNAYFLVVTYSLSNLPFLSPIASLSFTFSSHYFLDNHYFSSFFPSRILFFLIHSFSIINISFPFPLSSLIINALTLILLSHLPFPHYP